MHLLYILSKYPTLTETFIDREIQEMKKHANISIFSLKNSGITNDEIINIPYLSFDLIFGNIIKFIKSPILYLKTFYLIISMNCFSFSEIIKSLVIFPKSVLMSKKIKQYGITHIHAEWATIPTTSAIIISNLSGIKFSFSAHAWDIYKNNISLKKKISMAQFIITCTNYNLKYLNQITGNKFTTKIYHIYHGLNFTNQMIQSNMVSKNNKSVPIILFVGSLREKKGVKYLIESCRELVKQNIKFKCVIIGDGILRKKLSNLVHELELEKLIEFKGYLDNDKVNDYYQKASMLVVPSVIDKQNDRDGIPNVILEAMNYNVPVVASNLSGIPEVVIDKKTGLLVNSGNSKQLADSIQFILKDNFSPEKLTKNASEMIIQKFNIELNVKKMFEVFNKNA
jgi:colanic acid/amylovoran biosynthesis glycosyltransferase